MLGARQAVNFVTLLAMAAFLLVNIRPIRSYGPTRRLRQLETGSALLGQFLVSAAASVILQCALWMQGTESETFGGKAVLAAAASILWCVLAEGIVFWNGMIRVYLTSVQLGIKTRILAALVWWIPGVNIWYLMKIMRLTGREAELETEKWELDEVLSFTANNDAAAALTTGKVDAWVVDNEVAVALAAQQGLTVLDEAMTSEPYAFAFAKGSDELVSSFNASLKKLMDDGSIQEIFDKYGVLYVAPEA